MFAKLQELVKMAPLFANSKWDLVVDEVGQEWEVHN